MVQPGETERHWIIIKKYIKKIKKHLYVLQSHACIRMLHYFIFLCKIKVRKDFQYGARILE